MEPHQIFIIDIVPMATNRMNEIILVPAKPGSRFKRPMIIKTKEARAWLDHFVWHLKKARKAKDYPTITGPVHLEVWVYRLARRGDYDNYAKAIGDALQSAKVVRNDSQIDDGYIHRRHDPERPRYEIHLTMLPGTQHELELPDE